MLPVQYDPSGNRAWYLDVDGNPQEETAIFYDVPCLNQGNTNRCWAYCVFMQECYERGRELSEIEQKRFIRSWAVIYMICYYLDTGLPFWLQGQRTEITTIYDLYTVLVTHGPVYAAYDNLTNTSEDHIVLVTGVDIS